MSTKERKHPAPPRYDEAFKAGAVRMVTEQGRPSREMCIRDRRNNALNISGIEMFTAPSIRLASIPSTKMVEKIIK